MKVMVLAEPEHAKHGGGGAEKVLSTLTFALGDSIDFVIVRPSMNLSGEHDFPYKAKRIEPDVKWNEPTRNMFHRIYKLLYRAKELRRIIQEEDPDVILSNAMYVWHHLILGLKLSGLTTKRVILRFGTPVFLAINRHNRLYTILMHLAVQGADRVIAISQGLAGELKKTLGVPFTKIEVINNPIPVGEIMALAQEEVHESPFDDNLPIILNVGRLVPRKNQALLIQAFQKVQEHIEANLVIVGAGEYEDRLHKLVHYLDLGERVHFLGWQSNPFKYMRRADIFVNSSDNGEGFCNVIVEAMVCGCPVITTDSSYGPSEILRGGEYGILVPVGDEERLAREIVRVLGDQELRQTMVRKGKQRAGDFNVDAMANQYARIFHELANQ